MRRLSQPRFYTVPLLRRRVPTIIPEGWSILWLSWWVLSTGSGSPLFYTVDHRPVLAWSLMRDMLPQQWWALPCFLIATIQIGGLYASPRWHRATTALAAAFWTLVAATFLNSAPLTTGVIYVISMSSTLIYVATEAREE